MRGRVRAAGRIEERECRRWPALGVGLGVVASKNGQKSSFARP